MVHRRFRFGPDVVHDDGLLDLCVFSPSSPVDFAQLAWRLLRQRFHDDRRLTYRRGRSFSVETSPARQIQMDGELAGVTPFSLEVEPQAATVLLPRASGP
jgi:diacylglycerol kinase family enzyme